MTARKGQRKRPQVAVEAHFEQRAFQNGMAFGAHRELRLRQQPHGIHGPAAEPVHGIGRVVTPVVEDRAVALEAGPGPLGDLISVVDPAGERLQPGRFHRGVREHHDARQTADERGVERVDVHPRLRRRKFHLAHARKPLHSLLHVVFQPGATQHVAHDDGSRVKIAHAVPQVVQGSLRTSRGEALIQKMPRQQHIHPLQLRPLGGVRSGIVGHGDLEQEVVVFAQRLAVVVEQFADIGMAQIDIGLGIAHEPDRLAPKRPVGIFRNAVCVEAFAQGLHRHRLPAFEQQFAQTPFDGRHIAPLPLTDRGGECGHRIAPRLQQREPVARGRGVDERRLEIGRMVPHVLKRGENQVVEIQLAPFDALRRDDQFVHPLLGPALHVAVESHPCPAPAGELQSVVEPRAGAPLLAELETQFPVERLRGVDPEHEGRNGGLPGIGIFRQVTHRGFDAHPGARPRPLPAERVRAVLVMVARDGQRRAFRRRERRRRLLKRKNPRIGDLPHRLRRCGPRPHRRSGEKQQFIHGRPV